MRRLTFLAPAVIAAMCGEFASSVAYCQCGDGAWPGVFDSIPSMAATGPVPLFDGQTLNGWGDREGKPNDKWDIENGAIHRKKGGNDLYLQQIVGDFELSFEWKIASGGNSGVKYRVAQYGDQWLGCEYQLLDDGGAVERNKTAGLYDVVQPDQGKPLIRAGEWNYSRIVVRNGRIEHWLNGLRVLAIQAGSGQWYQSVGKGKFSGIPGFGLNRYGRIFLQNHGSEVWFRNLYLTSFPEQMPECLAGYPACPAGPAVRYCW